MKINGISPKVSFGMFRKDAAEHCLRTSENYDAARRLICEAYENRQYHIGLNKNNEYFIYKDHPQIGVDDESRQCQPTTDAKEAVELAKKCRDKEIKSLLMSYKGSPPGTTNILDLLTKPNEEQK